MSVTLWAWIGAVLLLLYVPMLPPLLFSLGDHGVARALSDPSLAAYTAMWKHAVLMDAVVNSIGVAVVVGVVTPALALLAAMAVRELGMPRVVMVLMLVPLFIPGVSMGLATAFLFERLGLDPSILSICLVNILWALPFAFLIMLTVMSSYDTVQTEAAWMLGSNRWQAFRRVEFPAIRSGVIGASTFSMILSFNETARTSLVQGAHNTVQTYIWSSYKQVGLTSTLYALMTILILLTLLMVMAFWAAEHARNRSLAKGHPQQS